MCVAHITSLLIVGVYAVGTVVLCGSPASGFVLIERAFNPARATSPIKPCA